MYLSHLGLTDYRNYASCEIELPPGPVVFLGSNGQGKTNLVEAVGYLCTLASHRVSTDAALVRVGATAAVVTGRLIRDSRSVMLQVEITPGRTNRAWLNRSKVRRPRDILGYARVVTFAPEDLALVRGDPEQRRRYLDELLVLRSPRFTAVRSDYDRALRQRNALLRRAAERSAPGASEPTGLREWDETLAALGGEITAARCALVEHLAPRVGEAYSDVAPHSGAATIRYRSESRSRSAAREGGSVPSVPAGEEATDPGAWAETILGRLQAARREELARGVTVAGPHRDDLDVELAGHPVKGFASHGEGWSLALSLRLASYGLLRDDWQDTPILVLDDVFAELDSQRRERLVHLASECEQVLVTAAVAEDVPDALRGASFAVSSGVVTAGRRATA